MKTVYRSFILICFVHIASGRYLDMTHNFNNESQGWPLYRKFTFTIFNRGPAVLRSGTNLSWFEANDIDTSEHMGTHMDAPAHVSKGAWRVHEIPIENLIGPAVMIDIRKKASKDPDSLITVDDITQWEAKYGNVPENAIVFQCSGWSERYFVDWASYWGNDKQDSLDFHFPGFGLEAAKYLVETRKISGIAADTPSFDYGPSLTFPVHTYIGARNIYGIEHAKDTCKMPESGATVYALPIKTEDGSGGPVRLVASWGGEPNRAATSSRSICAYLLSVFAIVVLH